eukprot:1586414-Lingulodinium_polyedra.AAC.1
MSAAQPSQSEGARMGRVVRASARRLYGQLAMSERLALVQRMDAAGVVPQELAADFKAYRANLQ